MESRAPAKAPPIVPGTILDGKYQVERVLGQGGTGLVVEARHLPDDARVALKLLLPPHAAEPAAAARFLRGANTTAKLKSEHVTRVYDIGKLADGAPYMAMELLEGRDLGRTLSLSSVLPVADAIDYVLQACEAITEAHAQGIIHRDLKPSNLFLSRRVDGSPIVKVLDFDNALIVGDGGEGPARRAAAMDSVLYVSPEQMQQGREVDHRTDIYTLGIALYELIGGKHPFYAETLPQLCAEILTGTPAPLSTLRPEVPEELAQVIAKAYARDREGRYPTVADFMVALAPFAPPRSQATIERVARMAGLPVPGTGAAVASAVTEGAAAPPDAASTPVTDEASTSVAPPPSTAPAPALAAASSLATAPSAAAPALPARRAGSDPHQIILSPYSAPMSARAAARFARGHANDGSFEPSAESPVGLGRTGALALSITGILAVGGVAMLFALRSGGVGSGPAPTKSVEHVTTATEMPIPPASPKPSASLEAERAAAPSSTTPGASAAESASAGSAPSAPSASTSRSAAPRAPSKTPTNTTTPEAIEHHGASR